MYYFLIVGEFSVGVAGYFLPEIELAIRRVVVD
jgi:hypothetical protein